jgi:dihydrofolate reductase
MTVHGILAISDNDVIGVHNRLPWRLPIDLKWFKMNTYGGAVIMGRRTWDSLARKPLPGRTNIVLSHKAKPSNTHVHWFNHLKTALEYAVNTHTHTYVIGGAQIFRQTSSFVDVWLVTRVHATCQPSNATLFRLPTNLDRLWNSETKKENGYSFHFEMYRKSTLNSKTLLRLLDRHGL